MNRPEIYSNVYLTGARNCMKVHEYMKFMNNAYLEIAEYCDHLEKALDKACELIAEAVNQDCTIFDEVLESPYLYRTEVREWKEWLLHD